MGRGRAHQIERSSLDTPANFPFVDAGQVLVVDRSGFELVSRWHLLPGDFIPAERPGDGRPIGNPIFVTAAQAQNLVHRERSHRLVLLYLPLFYDCHTFVCLVTAKVRAPISRIRILRIRLHNSLHLD